MAGTNEILPFCPTDSGSNLLTQAAYAAAANRTSGNQPGIASSQLNNKAIRQASYIASCVAQFLVNETGDSILDDATPSEVLATMAKVWPAITGSITMYGAAAAPTGYHLCDGAAVSRTGFAALFAVIGTTYGVGDGSTTFNLPDLRGIFPRGTGTNGSLTYAAGGSVVGPALGAGQSDQMQGHHHSVSAVNPTGTGYTLPAGSGQGTTTDTGGPDTDGSNGTPRVGLETRPFSLGVNFIIKT